MAQLPPEPDHHGQWLVHCPCSWDGKPTQQTGESIRRAQKMAREYGERERMRRGEVEEEIPF